MVARVTSGILAVILSTATYIVCALPTEAGLQALLDRYGSEPANALLCEQIGVSYTRLGEFSKAAEFFRQAVRLNPDRIPAQKNLGTVLWYLGRKDESASVFRSLETRIPNDPVPELYLGLSAYDQKDMEKAAAHLQRAGSLASDNPEVLPVVVEVYLATGRFATVRQLLEGRIVRGVSDPQTYRWLGDAYNKGIQPEKAFAAYSKAIQLEPTNPDNYLALAGFCIEHANPGVARETLTRGLAQTPNQPKLLLEYGLAWAIEGDFDQARRSFSDSNTFSPAWSLPLLALGVTDLQTGNAKEAAECFRKAKSIAPDDYRCYYLHAMALSRSQSGEDASVREAAVKELRHAIALNPQFVKSRVLLAQNDITAGDLTAAEDQLRAALRTDPSESDALYKLALLCRRKGKLQEAERLMAAFKESKSVAERDENEFVLILRTVK